MQLLFKKKFYTLHRNWTWFSRLVRLPARKRSGSILTTPEPARGAPAEQVLLEFRYRRLDKKKLE